MATLGLGRAGNSLERLENFDSAAETFCQHLFGKGCAQPACRSLSPATFRPMWSPSECRPICVWCRLAAKNVRDNAYVYVKDQNWSGFSSKDLGCSADGGM